MATQTKLVTYDDYRNLPDDGKRYEIIQGEVLMSPAPNTLHQRIVRKLLIILSSYVEKQKNGEVFCAPIDVVLSMTDVVQPDLVFVAKDRFNIITQKNIVAAPDLVVEVLSKKTAVIDRNQKKDLYEKYGVREYWIVDSDEKKIEQHVLEGDTFESRGCYNKSEKLVSEVMTDFSLPLKKIFAS